MCPSRGFSFLHRSRVFWTVSCGVSLGVMACLILPYIEGPSNYKHILSFSRGRNASSEELNKLIIGVLSGRSHFDRRQGVRNTWGKFVDKKIVDLKFVVGSEDCPIPPLDRATPYSCEPWTPRLPEDDVIISNIITSDLNGESSVGFTFLVKQNISVVRLSLSSNLLTSLNRIARVVLIDSFHSKTVSSATFGFDPGRNSTRLLSKRVSPLRLPINFEGEIRIITSSSNPACPFELELPSAVHVFEVLQSTGTYVPLSKRSRSTTCGGFGYIIEDENLWKSLAGTRASRVEEWITNQKSIGSRLFSENAKYGDILFARILDVYVNLFWKTKFFLEWASSSGYDFVLKTDDDVFLDVPKIVKELRSSVEYWDWWSCFKIGWSPPNAGKWRDRLSSSVYPPFPSGSGYVIRMSAVREMLSRPFPRTSVGEDVAVGFLADGLNLKPLLESSCFWSCNENCARAPCNAPEVTPELMAKTYQAYSKCNEICDCPR